MGITEKTTIQELLCDHHISSTTYDILDIARLETVEMILQYTDYAQNFPRLFGISGLLYQNYKELQDVIFPLVQKAYVNSKKEQKRTNKTNQVQAENKGQNTMLGIKDLDNPCYAFDANTQKENLDVTSNTFGATSKGKTIKKQNAIEHQVDEFSSMRDNRKIGTLHIFLTTTIEELYEKKVISCETYNALNSIKIHSYSDILSLSKKFKDFNELSLCANFSKLSISEIKELGNYCHGLKDVHCEKAAFDEKNSAEKLVEKNEKLHESEEAISVKNGESSEQVKSVNDPKNISPSIKKESLGAEEELPSLSMPTTQNRDKISYKSEFAEEAIFNNTFDEPEKNDIEALDTKYNTCYTYDASKHPIFHKILTERELTIPTNPIWKMNITPQEQHLLEECLHQAYLKDNLYAVGEEAALYYAVWWQRSYAGGSPSSEAVAQSANIPQEYSDELYKSARLAYKRWGFGFLHDSRFHYFRSLLMQGGLPINHVVTNKGNFNGYPKIRSLII